MVKTIHMASPAALKALALLTFWPYHPAHGKRLFVQTLTTFLKPRADATTLDPYRVTGNAAIEEDAAEVPMDHATAVTYVLSFGVIVAVVCGIFAVTLVVKYRKRRRTEGHEKADDSANWEKLGARGINAQDRFKRMGIFHPSTACLRQLDYRLPCRCPLCVAADDTAASAGPAATDLHSRTPTGSFDGFAQPRSTGPEQTRALPRRARNNENTFAGFIRTRPAPPVSPHEHEWTLFHGSSPLLAGSMSTPVPMPTRAGPELTPIEPARLSQMSPLSSLRSSLVRELERPPLFSDDSCLSTVRVATALNNSDPEDSKGSPLAEEASVTLETFTALKLVSEIDLSNKTAWISDADWVLANEPTQPPLEDIRQDTQCASLVKALPRSPLAKVEGNSA